MGTWFSVLGPSGAVHLTGSGAREISNLVVRGQESGEGGESARLRAEGMRERVAEVLGEVCLLELGGTLAVSWLLLAKLVFLRYSEAHFSLHSRDFCGCFRSKATA